MSVRVGFVVHVMQVAGAEVLVAETIQRLGSSILPTVYCLDAEGALGSQLSATGIAVHVLGRTPGIDLRLVGRLAWRLRVDRIGVLHAHQYTPFFYSSLANVVAGRPARVIHTEHGRHFPDVVSPKRHFVNRWLLQYLASDVNAVARFSADAVRTIDGFDKWPVEVIPNGIETGLYGAAAGSVADAQQRLGLPTGRRYVTCVARFHPVKDHATLLSAFAIVAAARPDVDLLLAGDGALRPELEAQVAQLGLVERVHLLGVRRDVPVVLRASTVFTLASVSEGASITVLEAMASGLPLVLTDVGGNPELVRHNRDGLLVPRSSPAAMADALGAILDDEQLAERLGASAASRAVADFDITHTIARYAALYGVTPPATSPAPSPL